MATAKVLSVSYKPQLPPGPPQSQLASYIYSTHDPLALLGVSYCYIAFVRVGRRGRAAIRV